MKNCIPVGGKKHRSWRLKKKYNKWFQSWIHTFIRITLEEIPKEFFERMFDLEVYDFSRLYV